MEKLMKNLNIRDKAEVLRQLAHPIRLQILEELATGAKCVTDIQDLLEIPQPNVSQHLLVLRRNRIVDFYEDGPLRCYYLLRPALVTKLFHLLSSEYPIVERDREEVRLEGRQREQRNNQKTSC
jgi:ArsR family transcriptional regulator, arsenate/arsenite/antimonite-responsive transcriptional repressor